MFAGMVVLDLCLAKIPSAFSFTAFHRGCGLGIGRLLTVKTCDFSVGWSFGEAQVNTQIGFLQITELQQELLQPAYAHSLIFVAWEHIKLYEFALELPKSYGITPVHLLEWPNSDYETIDVFHITWSGKDSTPRATLEIQNEDLGKTLSDACSGPQ